MATNREIDRDSAVPKSGRGGSTTGYKLLSVLGGVLCVILLPILIMNCTLIVKSLLHPDEVPKISGVFPLIVLTDSMYPEIQSGDLIICRSVAAEEVKVGDVIAFVDPEGNGVSLVTHRVIEIETGPEGERLLRTQGDANNIADPTPVPAENLLGRYVRRIPGLGNVVMFMQSTPGLIVCVVLPMALFVGYDVIRRRRYEKRHRDDTQALLRELEELRKKQNAKKDGK